MTWQLFWANVFPAYLGAIGSIAASTVAVIALIRDLRTRKGLREVAQTASSTVDLPRDAPSIAPRSPEPAGDQPLALITGRRRTIIRNLTREPVEIIDVRIPSGGKSITLAHPLPMIVQPGEGIGLTLRDQLTGPALAAMLVEWAGTDGRSRLTTLFV